MESKKINQLATEMSPASTDLTIIGDPITGVSKKVTLEQISSLFSGLVSFYANYAAFPATGAIDTIYCAKDTSKLYLWSGSAYVEVFPSQALLNTYQLRSEKGNANGYASLDSLGKVPVSQLPSSLMEYKGTWNAATNTPTLANGTGDTGDVYICSVAGTVNFGAGAITFAVGDYVIYSGTIWQRSSGATGTVTSVAVTETGNALTITGSPITTSGTINIGFAGASTEYVAGDGSLVTFPTLLSSDNLVKLVRNQSGATMTAGTVVYISGATGNKPLIAKALATGDATSAQTYGLLQTDIANNADGYVVVIGNVSNLDTSALTEGQQLYLSGTTAGTYTTTKPYAPIHLVYVGIVLRAHPTMGIIGVKIQNGYEMDELHNVDAYLPNNNDILSYNTTTSLWEHKQIATTLGYTPANDSLVVHLSGNETITGVKTFTSQPKLDGTLAIKEGTSGTLTGYTVLGANVNQLLIGVVGATHTLTFNSSSSYGYTFPNATGTLALTSDIPSLTGYVPYTGATGNVTLGVYKLTATNIDVLGANAAIKASDSGAQLILGVNGLASSLVIGSTGDSNFYGQVYLTPAATAIVGMLKTNSSGKILAATAGTDFVAGGTGTTNYVSKFTASGTIGNSNIFDNGTSVGIGTATPTAKLQVVGTGTVLVLGESSGSTGRQLLFGIDASTGKSEIQSVWQGTGFTSLTLQPSGGNVGIGTTSPSYTLDVNGTGRFSGSTLFNSDLFTYNNGGIFFSGLTTYTSGIFQNANGLNLQSGGNPRLVITSGGNVGIGTSSPDDTLHIAKNGISSYAAMHVTNSSSTASLYVGVGGSSVANTPLRNNGYIMNAAASDLILGTSDTERMRITSGGNVNINTTGNAYSTAAQMNLVYQGASVYGFNMKTTSGDGIPINFVNSSGSQVGYIFCNGSSTSYVTSSDYRLKQDLKQYNGLDLISAIKTYDYEWKLDKTRAYGVLAHELQEIIPQAVIGEKDAKQMQGVDYSKLVPVLVKAIQELEARLKTIENK